MPSGLGVSAKLNNERIDELLILLAISGPKGRGYCVFGDKAKNIFEYQNIEDTKINGKELTLGAEDNINKVNNNGIINVSAISTGNISNTKAYVTDYPKLTTDGIVIKYKRIIPVDTTIEFVKETMAMNSKEVKIIEEGSAKIEINLSKGNYEIKSKDIYFGKYGIIEKKDMNIREMILVKEGVFKSDNGDIISGKSFYIGKYEVTQLEWEEVMNDNKNNISPNPSYFINLDTSLNPVEQVSLYDILVYCNRLSIKEGLTPVYEIAGKTNPDEWGDVPLSNNETWNAVKTDYNANGYRLPTDTEWKYAANGGLAGVKTIYAGSNNIEDAGWYYKNSGDSYIAENWDLNIITANNCKTKLVGMKQSNELGIYDMSGNVWEWTNSAADNSSLFFILGGSWLDSDYICSVNLKEEGYVYGKSYNLGFRIARSVSEMVLVEAGEIITNNKKITISNSFYIDKYEVTQLKWSEIMSGNKNNISLNPSYFKDGDTKPVEQVSWYDILVYCNRLSIKEGLTPVYSIDLKMNPDDWGNVPLNNNQMWNLASINYTADGYRLPTYMEWKYAAMGGASGSQTAYAGSNNIEDTAWYYKNSGDIYITENWDWDIITANNCSTKSVGMKQANELGIYDMSGNVWEWTDSLWSDVENNRIILGGSWHDMAEYCTIEFKSYGVPNYRYDDTGFRLVKSKNK